jgi:tetratricopeptide (TPR) repeat protein
MSPLQNLHHHAEELREKEKFVDALKIYKKIIAGFQKEKDFYSMADALCGQSLTYKHLFLINKKQKHLDLALGSAKYALQIAKKHKVLTILHRCYFRLGEVDMLATNYANAVVNFQKSHDLLPNTSVEKSRALSHLAEAQYFNGNTKKVKSNLQKSLKILNKYKVQVDDYTKNVWETGILIKLYLLTKDKKYYSLAKKIIDSDPRLVIRKRQLAEILKSTH